MLFLLSPAKTLDFDGAALVDTYTQPRMVDRSQTLIDSAKRLTVDDVRALMGVSEKIAELNVQRFSDWSLPFDLQNAKQAVYAFKGDVYTGLNVETCPQEQIDYVDTHVRILSGLYGLLRPLDLMQPYRLEMGVKFETQEAANLYKFWGDQISLQINTDLSSQDDEVLVNLASNEYYKAVDKNVLKARVVTPVFKDLKNGAYKIVSFYAKKARGLMVRFAADNNISSVEGLKAFDYEGYVYSDALSDGDTWVFTRDVPPSAK